MTIFTQSDQALYKKLKSVFGSLIPTVYELEEFVVRTNHTWKDYCIDLSHISFRPSTEIIFDQSISDSLPKLSEISKHIAKELPFCCFGNINSTNSLYFDNMIVLTCNNKHSSGIDSLKNTIKYCLSNKQKTAIMIGIIIQNESCREHVRIRNLESIMPLIKNYHLVSDSYNIIYAVINNRILYLLMCDYT